MKSVFLILFLSTFTVMLSHAHGDLHKRIVKATKSIESDPENEDLYFHRGKLYYQHEDFNKGIADLHTAIEKGYEGEQVYLFLSKCHFSLEEYTEAEEQIQLYFSKNPNHVIAHNLYGQILYRQNKFAKSANEFQYVIENAIVPLPENYINAANSWAGLNSEFGLTNAVNILKRGLDDQGELISLQQHLIKLLMNAQQYDQAIEIQKSIISGQNRKEKAYYTLYEIAIAKGDQHLALDALTNAKNAYNQLPKRIKKNSAMIELYANIETHLQNLNINNSK